MPVPRYRNTADGSVVEAVRFVQADPRTHWHVNFGHPVAEALKDVYWVQTKTGPAEISDGDYVVMAGELTDAGVPVFPKARYVFGAIDFEADFELIPADVAYAEIAARLLAQIGGDVTVAAEYVIEHRDETVLVVRVSKGTKRPLAVPKSVDGMRVVVREASE